MVGLQHPLDPGLRGEVVLLGLDRGGAREDTEQGADSDSDARSAQPRGLATPPLRCACHGAPNLVSISTPVTLTPIFFEDFAVSAISVAWMRALEGMQPSMRQTPPRWLRDSTRMTSRPRSAARTESWFEQSLAETDDALQVLKSGGLHATATLSLRAAMDAIVKAKASTRARNRDRHIGDAIALLEQARNELSG